MNLSEIFIRRPVATSLLMVAIALFGVVAYRALPVSDLPVVDYPTISVSASLPGASPETMASAVATPLERSFSTIPGIDSMTSSSALGSTQITIQFSLERDLDGAAQDVQTAIARTTRQLPPGMPNPPSYRKVNPADMPIYSLALTSKTLPLYELNEYADTIMGQRISMINGVAQVQIMGSSTYAVRVQVDPTALAAKGMGIDEIAGAVNSWNVNRPTGELYGQTRSYTIQASGQLTRAEAYRDLVVTYRNGSPVRLQDVAKVFDSIENDKSAAWYYSRQDGARRGIILSIQKQPGTNTVDVVDRVNALLPGLQSQLPPSVDLQVMYDRSRSIRESFHDVQFTMLLSLGLVIMVIFLFLRNVSATLIPSLALPFSIIGTFSIMYLLGYSLNNLSMMALILSVGFVVDDAIVMLENIVRHTEEGEAPMTAAFMGSRQIGFTILSMTLSLTAVFIPVLFLGGIVGRLFREFAVTIATAILISGVVSITLTPMLCSRFLRVATGRRSWLFNASERAFQFVLRLYERNLRFSMRFRPVTLAISILVMAATAYLFTRIPKGFIPSEDNDTLSVTVEAEQGTAPREMFRYVQAIGAIVESDPNVDRYNANAGSGGGPMGGGGSNAGRLQLRLKPRKERAKSADQIMVELRPRLATVPGIQSYIQNPPPLRIGGFMTRAQYQYTLVGPDTQELYAAAQKLEAELRHEPGLIDVQSDLLLRKPMVQVDIDRDKAATLRLTVDQIETALSNAFSTRFISNIYTPSNQYQVIMEALPEYQDTPNALSMLYLRSGNGTLVPLDTVATRRQIVGPQSINHLGQLPSVTISYNLAPGTSLGQAMDRIREVSSQVLPGTISAAPQGTAQAFEQSFKNLNILLLVAVGVVYIVLGILYESYIHPITIFSGLPSAGFGALLTLMFFKVELNLYSFVGLIMLIGIVMKNAIMQIDFALDAEREQGLSPVEAIIQGCVIRFRPIMMTTMAALLGAVPIAIGYGAGGESRQPLGLVVVGGLLFSQLVTLYLTPVYYTYLGGAQRALQRRRRRGLEPVASAAD
ncbi:MAG: efflux RND transporter permease subunit [Bryobacterales bacterium]|nr:efflux RND transporter permease subunit [Bryobacterales bacterium]